MPSKQLMSFMFIDIRIECEMRPILKRIFYCTILVLASDCLLAEPCLNADQVNNRVA